MRQVKHLPRRKYIMHEPRKLEIEALRGHLSASAVEFEPNGTIRLPVWCRSVKVDVGLSFNAKMSFEWIQRQPNDLLVFAFEPVPENLKQIKAKMQSHPNQAWIRSRLILLPLALADKFGRQNFYVTQDTGQSSFLKPTKASIKEIEQVEVVTLKSLLSLIPVEKMPYIDYLKTDCQGTDLDVLRGAGDAITRFIAITSESETANYKGSINGICQIRKYLTGFGFVQINSRNPLRALIGDLIKRFDWLHTLFVIARKAKVESGRLTIAGISMEVEDPTFLNSMLTPPLGRQISIFQKG